MAGRLRSIIVKMKVPCAGISALTQATFLIMFALHVEMILAAGDGYSGNRVQPGIFYKMDQGATWGVILDQRMSNLYYEGPGVLLNFGRHSQTYSYINEWSFARLQYNYAKPAHLTTVVENPAAGIRYLYLRKLYSPDRYSIWAGGQANIFGNFRLAGRLGNSFLFADMIGELRPHSELWLNKRFFRREWNIELSAAASLMGYTIRIPEYGVSFELAGDGGVKIQGYEKELLTPFNYMHVTTGVFIRESFRGETNPNWFRIGYVWDYYTMKGMHGLNMNNALHQIVLELYFKIK